MTLNVYLHDPRFPKPHPYHRRGREILQAVDICELVTFVIKQSHSSITARGGLDIVLCILRSKTFIQVYLPDMSFSAPLEVSREALALGTLSLLCSSSIDNY